MRKDHKKQAQKPPAAVGGNTEKKRGPERQVRSNAAGTAAQTEEETERDIERQRDTERRRGRETQRHRDKETERGREAERDREKNPFCQTKWSCVPAHV